MKRLLFLCLICFSNQIFAQSICDEQPIVADTDTIVACRNDDVVLSATFNSDAVMSDVFIGEYTVTSNSTGCTSLAQATPTVVSFDANGVSNNIQLPFTFDFYGSPYNGICVSSDGYITFDCLSQPDMTQNIIPNTNEPNAVVALFWDDLTHSDGDIFYFESIYNEQNCFVVEYDNMVVTDMGGNAAGQIILCPDGGITLNNLEYTGDNAIQGIENEDGTMGEVEPGAESGISDIPNCVTFTPEFGDIECDENSIMWFAPNGNPLSIPTVNVGGIVGTYPYYASVDCNNIICSDTITVIVTGDCPGNELLVSNPVNDLMRLRINWQSVDEIDIGIITIAGQIIYQETLNLTSGENIYDIDTQALSSGLYIVYIGSGKDRLVSKFVRQ